MRQFLHLLLRHATKLPTFHPRPSPDISNRVLALPIPRQILSWFSGVLTAEMDFENAVHAQGFVAETVDCVGEFFFGEFVEVVELALLFAISGTRLLEGAGQAEAGWKRMFTNLIRRATPMPKEQPLQRHIPLKLILKPQLIPLIILLQKIQQFSTGLHNREWRVLRLVNKDRDPAVGVEAQEPVFLLLVGGDVDEGLGEGI